MQPSVRELVLSDYRRLRPSHRATVPRALLLAPFSCQMLAALFLRAQQALVRRGWRKPAWGLRTVGAAVTGADFVPGCEVGRAVLITHPSGIVLGPGSRVGDDVTFAGGVTLGVRNPEELGRTEYPTIGDGVFLGAHAVVMGPVHVGDGAIIGANSVVRDDVPAKAIMSGIPAVQVGERTNLSTTTADA